LWPDDLESKQPFGLAHSSFHPFAAWDAQIKTIFADKWAALQTGLEQLFEVGFTCFYYVSVMNTAMID
jgi:hypothetical protein